MKEIVKVLLQEGIDEETIHEVLSVIEENYEIVDETVTVGDAVKAAKKVQGSRLDKAINTTGSKYPRAYNRAAFANALAEYPEDSKVPLKTLLQAAKGSLEQRKEKSKELESTAHFKKGDGGYDKRYSKQNRPYQKAVDRELKVQDLTKTSLDEH